jgi:GNAT superfamily N-acetyltransferase
MKFLIRDYRESDFEHFEFCTNEIQKCIEAIDSWEMMELGNNYSKLTSNLYLDEIKTNKGLIKIAEADGKPVGTGLAIVTDGDPIIKNKYKKEYLRTGWIKNVFVDESCRGQGI